VEDWNQSTDRHGKSQNRDHYNAGTPNYSRAAYGERGRWAGDKKNSWQGPFLIGKALPVSRGGRKDRLRKKKIAEKRWARSGKVGGNRGGGRAWGEKGRGMISDKLAEGKTGTR